MWQSGTRMAPGGRSDPAAHPPYARQQHHRPGAVAQLAEAHGLGPCQCGFESHRPYFRRSAPWSVRRHPPRSPAITACACSSGSWRPMTLSSKASRTVHRLRTSRQHAPANPGRNGAAGVPGAAGATANIRSVPRCLDGSPLGYPGGRKVGRRTRPPRAAASSTWSRGAHPGRPMCPTC